jgi:hypothetical protein
MALTPKSTPNYNFTLPTVGGDTNVWGDLLNSNWSKLDTLLNDIAVTLASVILPPGSVIMWAGAPEDVPAGWRICDGSNGTPDLRNRFVLGAGDNDIGDTGGRKVIAEIPAHNHDVGTLALAAGGAHTHVTQPAALTGNLRNISQTWAASGAASGIFAKGGSSVGSSTPVQVDNGESGQINIDASHSHNILASGEHSHALTGETETVGNPGGVDYTPPFYALAYIIKV